MSTSSFQSPGPDSQDEQAAMSYDPDDTSGQPSEQSQQEQDLLAIAGVTGVGKGRDRIGNDAIIVYVLDASAAKRVPSQIGGTPVVIEVTGPIDAQPL